MEQYSSHVNVDPPLFSSLDLRLVCLCVACIYASSVWSDCNNVVRCLGQGGVERYILFLSAVYRIYYRYYCYPHFSWYTFSSCGWVRLMFAVIAIYCILHRKPVYLPPRPLKLLCALTRISIMYREWFAGHAYQ